MYGSDANGFRKRNFELKPKVILRLLFELANGYKNDIENSPFVLNQIKLGGGSYILDVVRYY